MRVRNGIIEESREDAFGILSEHCYFRLVVKIV